MHALQIPAEVVLVRQGVHPWVVVYPLVGVHLLHARRHDACVAPEQVPVGILVVVELELEPATRFLNNSIFGFLGAQDQLLGLLLLGFFVVFGH